MNADGSNAHEYSMPGVISPNGLFSVQMREKTDVYLTNGKLLVLEVTSTDGSNLHKEADLEMVDGVENYVHDLTWSPDSQSLAFIYQNDVLYRAIGWIESQKDHEPLQPGYVSSQKMGVKRKETEAY